MLFILVLLIAISGVSGDTFHEYTACSKDIASPLTVNLSCHDQSSFITIAGPVKFGMAVAGAAASGASGCEVVKPYCTGPPHNVSQDVMRCEGRSVCTVSVKPGDLTLIRSSCRSSASSSASAQLVIIIEVLCKPWLTDHSGEIAHVDLAASDVKRMSHSVIHLMTKDYGSQTTLPDTTCDIHYLPTVDESGQYVIVMPIQAVGFGGSPFRTSSVSESGGQAVDEVCGYSVSVINDLGDARATHVYCEHNMTDYVTLEALGKQKADGSASILLSSSSTSIDASLALWITIKVIPIDSAERAEGSLSVWCHPPQSPPDLPEPQLFPSAQEEEEEASSIIDELVNSEIPGAMMPPGDVDQTMDDQPKDDQPKDDQPKDDQPKDDQAEEDKDGSIVEGREIGEVLTRGDADNYLPDGEKKSKQSIQTTPTLLGVYAAVAGSVGIAMGMGIMGSAIWLKKKRSGAED